MFTMSGRQIPKPICTAPIKSNQVMHGRAIKHTFSAPAAHHTVSNLAALSRAAHTAAYCGILIEVEVQPTSDDY